MAVQDLVDAVRAEVVLVHVNLVVGEVTEENLLLLVGELKQLLHVLLLTTQHVRRDRLLEGGGALQSHLHLQLRRQAAVKDRGAVELFLSIELVLIYLSGLDRGGFNWF